jgi:hypothetical protein
MMRMSVKIDRVPLYRLQKRLPLINQAVAQAATDTAARAIASIEQRSTQYRPYKRRKGGTRIHWSSQPGHPPNKDYGRLSGSIRPEPAGQNAWDVKVSAKYGIALEVGTKRTAARPFLVPAFMVVKPVLVKAIRSILELN